MAKVLGEVGIWGTQPGAAARHVHTCGAHVEFTRGDVQHDERDGNYVVCPQCKTTPWIAESLLVWTSPGKPRVPTATPSCCGDSYPACKHLHFSELQVGECFIALPQDGDDAGHGGLRNGGYVFRKTGEDCGDTPNSRRIGHVEKYSSMPGTMPVYKVIL